MNINGLEIKIKEEKDTEKDVQLANELVEYINENKENKRVTYRLSFMGNDKLLNNGFVDIKKSDNAILGDYVVTYIGGKTYMSTSILIGTMKRYFSDLGSYYNDDSDMVMRHMMKFVAETPLVEEVA